MKGTRVAREDDAEDDETTRAHEGTEPASSRYSYKSPLAVAPPRAAVTPRFGTHSSRISPRRPSRGLRVARRRARWLRPRLEPRRVRTAGRRSGTRPSPEDSCAVARPVVVAPPDEACRGADGATPASACTSPARSSVAGSSNPPPRARRRRVERPGGRRAARTLAQDDVLRPMVTYSSRPIASKRARFERLLGAPIAGSERPRPRVRGCRRPSEARAKPSWAQARRGDSRRGRAHKSRATPNWTPRRQRDERLPRRRRRKNTPPRTSFAAIAALVREDEADKETRTRTKAPKPKSRRRRRRATAIGRRRARTRGRVGEERAGRRRSET